MKQDLRRVLCVAGAFILLLFFSLAASARTFYVAPETADPPGNDDNPGTREAPWATWGKAFNSNQVMPGDTVYFRGGVYYKVLAEGESTWYYPSRDNHGGTGYGISRDGLPGAYIHFYAYPDDLNAGNPPILDNNGVSNQPMSDLVYGIRAIDVNHVKFYGLQVRNVDQNPGEHWAEGWKILGNDIFIENCKVYDVHGVGFVVGGNDGDVVHVINCDAYLCCDSLSSELPGNDGSGFRHIDNGSVYYKGCRAWLCGDQGFSNGIDNDYASEQYTDYVNCWAFNNGMLEGGGSGFKMGWIKFTDGGLKRTYYNCIAAYNRWNGWKTNDYRHPYAVNVNIYHCTSYRNGYGGLYNCSGYEIHDTHDTDQRELNRTLINNIAFDNEDGPVFASDGSLYSHSFNSWELDVTVDSSDFLSLDSTGLAGPRQPDGSLPDLDFLKLKEESDLIDQGTDLGYGYKGEAPDLGAYEYGVQPENNNAFPTAEIISPDPGSEYIAPADITIDVSATDPDGTIRLVEVFDGTTKVGDMTSGPWSFNWTGVPEGSYSLSVLVTDDLGATTRSSRVNVAVKENLPPTVKVTSPESGSEFIGPLTLILKAEASDPDGSISKVEFFSGSTKLGEQTTPPWNFTFRNAKVGEYYLTAVATDNGGATATSSRVNFFVRANSAPSVTLASPANGSEFLPLTTIPLVAEVDDSDGTIGLVEFFEGENKLGETTSHPWTFYWEDVAEGSYTLSAVASDNLNTKSASETVQIEVTEALSFINQPPVVSLVNPPEGARFKKNVNIVLEAEAYDDDGFIVRVEFFSNDSLLGEAHNPPYNFTMEGVKEGNFRISASAIDNLNEIALSSSLELEVDSKPEMIFDHDSEIFHLYPNPNNGVFSIEITEPLKETYQPVMISIISIEGRPVYCYMLEKGERTRQFDLSHIKPGIYILKIIGNYITATKKFLKI